VAAAIAAVAAALVGVGVVVALMEDPWVPLHLMVVAASWLLQVAMLLLGPWTLLAWCAGGLMTAIHARCKLGAAWCCS
jgi:hypothetical protein